MIQLKELQIPESTLDLRDFSDYAKSFSEYEEFADFYKKQIKRGEEKLYKFGIKILREHFIKDEKEWSLVLNENDLEKLVKLKSENYKHKNEIFIKCNKTNTFVNLTESYYNQYKSGRLSINVFEKHLNDRHFWFNIKNQKIILTFDYVTDYFKAPYRNRDGGYQQHYEIYNVDLLDYSVTYEHKTKWVKIPSEIPHNRFG